MMKLSPKKICKQIKLIMNIGFCKIYDFPCICFYCHHLKYCKKDNIECELRVSQSILINKTLSIKFISKLKELALEMMDSFLNSVSEKERIILLIYLREKKLISISTYPSEYLFIPFINDLISKESFNLEDFSIDDFKKKNLDLNVYTKIQYLIVSIINYTQWISMIENGDGVILVAKKEISRVKKLVEENNNKIGYRYVTERYLLEKIYKMEFDKSFRKVKRGDKVKLKQIRKPKLTPPSFFFSLSNKMEQPYIWAKKNNINPWNSFINLKSELKVLIDHICDVGKHKLINASDCVRVAKPFHLNILNLLKNVMIKEKFYTYNQAHLKTFYERFQKEFRKILHNRPAEEEAGIKILYDNVISHMDAMDRENIFQSKHMIDDFSDDWQFKCKDGILMGSVLFFSIISMYYEELFSTKRERGFGFEDYICYLINKSKKGFIKIRNKQYIGGEIDFISQFGEDLYLIEAKNYSPWHSRNGDYVYYMGSEDFKKRTDRLQSSIDILEKRLLYCNQNKLEFNLNNSKDISKGLILTFFQEFFLRIPNQFELLSIDEFELFLDYSPISLIDYNINRKIPTKEKTESPSNYII